MYEYICACICRFALDMCIVCLYPRMQVHRHGWIHDWVYIRMQIGKKGREGGLSACLSVYVYACMYMGATLFSVHNFPKDNPKSPKP